ncbi:MAG: hypothetical protein ACT452_10070, partial [Microthrixaceae bacterium]
MSSPPSATPEPPLRSGPGCLVIGLLLPVVIVAGIVIGTILDQPGGPDEERSVTLDEGTIDGTAWRVDAVRDIEGESCAFLYADGEQLSGGCEHTPDDATFGDRTVVFGATSADTTTVRVVLSDARVVEIDTVEADGIDGRFYVT